MQCYGVKCQVHVHGVLISQSHLVVRGGKCNFASLLYVLVNEEMNQCSYNIQSLKTLLATSVRPRLYGQYRYLHKNIALELDQMISYLFIFLILSQYPTSVLNYTQHAKSTRQDFFSIKTYLQQLCPLLFASQLSLSNWKKYSFCVHSSTGWETPLARVCLWKSCVALRAVRFLVLSLSTFQPITLQGKELWASSF